MHTHQFTNATDVKAFVLAGNARITLVSKKTGVRFSYRVRQPEENKPHFVGILTQADNENGYTYLGTIFKGSDYVHGKRSRLTGGSAGAVAFAWFWKAMTKNALPDSLEVWHEGRCGRCGRTLTVPESIAQGLGPECIKKGRIIQGETRTWHGPSSNVQNLPREVPFDNVLRTEPVDPEAEEFAEGVAMQEAEAEEERRRMDNKLLREGGNPF
jgi:hypothetical protein